MIQPRINPVDTQTLVKYRNNSEVFGQKLSTNHETCLND